MQENGKKIAVNTIMLYIRMVVVMLVSLYTSRMVINALGVEDYGLYMAIGGFVALFAVISNSLSAAISRYITFELGKKEGRNVSGVFSASLFLQILIALLLLIVFGLFGLDFMEGYMRIPEYRLVATRYVFIFSLLTFSVSLLNVPYISMIIAYERMTAFAYIGVVEAIGRLAVAFFISYQSADKLVMLTFLLFLFSIVILLFYIGYCKIQFKDCKFVTNFRLSLIKEIFGFTGWNFVGAASGVLREQGVNLLLNIYSGLVVNAARGIAVQVSSAVSQFANSIITAINPQITKLYASGDKGAAVNLVLKGARFSALLLLYVVIPLMLETVWILETWIKVVPDYTVVFVRLVLINVAIDSLSSTMITLILATGTIRNYQIIVGGCLILNFPLSFFLLRNGVTPASVYWVSIAISVLCLNLRMLMLRKTLEFPVMRYVKEVLCRVFLVLAVSIFLPIYVSTLLQPSFMCMLLVFVSTLFSVSIASFAFGCEKEERIYVLRKFRLSN